MKIALLTNGIYPYVIGGMQKHSFYLAKYLIQAGETLDIYYWKPENDDIKKDNFIREYFNMNEHKKLNFYNIEFPRLFRFPGHYIFENYLYSKNIYKKYQKLKHSYDLIYIQGFSGWCLLNQKSKNRSSGIFCVINFHGLEMFQKAADFKSFLKSIMLRSFVKKNLRKADAVISLGGKLTPILKKINKTIIEVPNGIEEKWINTDILMLNNRNTRKFLFIGRYERRKGLIELQEVIRELPKDLNYTFDFIGNVPKNMQIPHSKLKYHGIINNETRIFEILKDIDVLVCPSWSEGMPIVILEAMASGCAIIATDVGAVCEQVSSDNGWLIDPVNKKELKNAITEAIHLTNEELFKRRKKSIEKIQKKFLWNNIIHKQGEIFKIVKSK